jgi:hypothetical protein
MCMSKRLSLVIDDQAEEIINPFLDETTPQRQFAGGTTDAAILRTLLIRGAAELERERLAAGYAELAAELGDQDLEFAADSHAGMLRVLAAEAAADAA